MDPDPDDQQIRNEIRRVQNEIVRAKLIIRTLNFMLLDVFVFMLYKSWDDEFWFIWMTLYTVTIVVTIILVYNPDNVRDVPLGKLLFSVLTIMAWGFYGIYFESKRKPEVRPEERASVYGRDQDLFWPGAPYLGFTPQTEVGRKLVDSVFILAWLGQLYILKNGTEWIWRL